MQIRCAKKVIISIVLFLILIRHLKKALCSELRQRKAVKGVADDVVKTMSKI